MLQSKLRAGDQKEKREERDREEQGMYVCISVYACVHAAHFTDWVHFQLLERLVVWLVAMD